MWLRCSAWFACLAAIAAPADKPAKLPPDIQQAAGLAMAAPAEFAADALLRLATARVSDRDARRELVETAFRLATRAQHPYRRVPVQGSAVDTRSGYLGSALRLNLDALSLEARAVDLMFGLDARAARDLFAQMALPAIEPLTCEAALVPDVSAYYAALTRVAQESFTAKEKLQDAHVQFVQGQLDRITSHAELAPAAAMVAALEWTPSQFVAVSSSLLGKLETIGPDPRTFGAIAREFDGTLSQLLFRARQYNAHPERIAGAYRAYLVANLSAGRCADSSGIQGLQFTGSDLPLFGEDIRGGLAPLSAEEIRPKKLAGEMKLERYWQSAGAQRVFEECLRLRTGPDGLYLPESARATREWKRQLTDFLSHLAGWNPGDEESEADYYHQRAIVYEALLELTPGGEQRARVLDDYIAFLKSSSLQQHNPVEWYWHAHSALRRVRTAQPAEAKRILAAFAASGNVVLALEEMLDRLAPDHSMFQQ